MPRERLAGVRLGVVFGVVMGVVFLIVGRLEAGLLVGPACALLIAGGLAFAPARTRLPWWGLAVPLLSMLDMAWGTPSLARVALTALLGLAGVAAGRWLETVPDSSSPRRYDRLVAVALALYAGATFAAITWKFIHFGDRIIAQDTGYFEQCFWGYTTGHSFFMGSSQAWWRYNPPLNSHFAMHFSPVMFPVAALYRLWPAYHVLHLLQVLAITLAAVPIYALVRRIDPRAGALFCLAYLANAAVVTQTQNAFHELAFAAPVASSTVYFFLRQRLAPFLACLVLGLMVREDLALLACMAGVAAVLVRDGRPRRLAWIVLPVVIGIVGGSIAGRAMASYGHSGAQVIVSLFSRFGATRSEIVAGMIRHPDEVIRMLLEGHRPVYLVGLLRPGLLAALVSPLSLLIVPALAINLLVRGAGTAWLDVHYSLYLPAVLMPAAIGVWLRWTPWLGTLASAREAAVRATLAVMMLLASVLSLPDVLGPQQLRAYVPPDDEAEIRAVVAAIPPGAAVAVPRFMVHALGRRERLFMVNRWSAYTRYDPEYVVVERDFRRVDLTDGSKAPYAAYAAFLMIDPRFEVVLVQPHFLLYRRRPEVPAPAPLNLTEYGR
jgi:uncharacterized membrane protein